MFSNDKIIDLKEKIHDLKEYLNSGSCKICTEIAYKLEEYIEELSALLENNDTNS